MGPLQECCNRIWKSRKVSEYVTLSTGKVPEWYMLQEK